MTLLKEIQDRLEETTWEYKKYVEGEGEYSEIDFMLLRLKMGHDEFVADHKPVKKLVFF